MFVLDLDAIFFVLLAQQYQKLKWICLQGVTVTFLCM